MFPSQSIPLIASRLHLTYVRNTGAAFGLLVDQRFLLISVGVIVIALVIYFHYRVKPTEYLTQVCLAFILGGSLGNIIDRVFRSYVVDYIDLRFWPVFNLADIMINLGVFLLILNLLISYKKPKTT